MDEGLLDELAEDIDEAPTAEAPTALRIEDGRQAPAPDFIVSEEAVEPAAAAHKAQPPGGLPLSPVREEAERRNSTDADTPTVHVDLRDGTDLGTPPMRPTPPVSSPPQLAPAPAPQAAPTNAPRTALHGLAQAWLASLATTGADGVDVPDVVIERLFAAFDLSATVVGGAIGAVMVASVKNDSANMAVVRKALAKTFTDESMQSLHALLSAELAARVHKQGSSGLTLRDPSCALSVVWLRRGLALQTGIIEGLVRERQRVRTAGVGAQLTSSALTCPTINTLRASLPPFVDRLLSLVRPPTRTAPQSMNTIVTNAYVTELETYHNWALRGTMKMAFNAAPNKDRVLRNFQGKTPLSPGADGYKTLYEDLAEVAAAQRRGMEALAKPLVALDLDRTAAASV